MLSVFEVHIAPGSDPDSILSDGVKKDTQAQVMTFAEARKVGFQGLPDSGGDNVRLIAVAKRDEAWILRVLENSPAVAGFKVHEVG
jgi:hypothetical protein